MSRELHEKLEELKPGLEYLKKRALENLDASMKTSTSRLAASILAYAAVAEVILEEIEQCVADKVPPPKGE